MDPFKQYFVAWLLSNIVFGLTIIGALRKPMLTRIFLAGFFLWASYFNSTSARKSPEIYLDYAKLDALPAYSAFINGFFAQHITSFVCTIATAQLLIFIGLVLNNIWTKLSCIGGIVFGVAIAPLGVGSGFPSTISMALAFFILLIKYEHTYIWNWKQYGIFKNVSIS